jgi:hypothetical protein
MSAGTQQQDPMDFLKNMWGNMGFTLPGMVTPTLDVDELEKRITDMKAVEGWLKMNLSGLQMTIQGLEMQRHTLAAFKAMSQAQPSNNAEASANANPFANPALWPWNVLTQAAAAATAASTPQAATGTPDTGTGQSGSAKTTKSDDDKKSA